MEEKNLNNEILEESGSYIESCNSDRERMQKLINKGYHIDWASNGNWCEINGETFNISKVLFKNWVDNGEIIVRCPECI